MPTTYAAEATRRTVVIENLLKAQIEIIVKGGEQSVKLMAQRFTIVTDPRSYASATYIATVLNVATDKVLLIILSMQDTSTSQRYLVDLNSIIFLFSSITDTELSAVF